MTDNPPSRIPVDTKTEEILEPVTNGNEYYWLKRHYEKHSITDMSKPIAELLKENQPLIDIPIYSLLKQGLWQCCKCGATIQSNPSKPEACYEDQGGCGRTSNFKPLTPILNPNLWKIPIWQDIAIDTKTLYEDTLTLIKRLIVFTDDIEYKIFTLWIISTWKLEAWETIGFPCFIGIPNSGKTQALYIIHNLGYRASKTSGVSSAVIPRLCEYWNVTLLVDECHNKLNPKSSEGSMFLDFVKDSYRKGSTYITCDNNDQTKFLVYKNYGFKAFAGEKTFNPALLTRSLVFWMEKANPEIPKLSYVYDELRTIQTKLLNYRVKTDNPPDLGKDFVLQGRTREIFESIIATAKHLGVPFDDIIQYAKDRDRREEDELMGSNECEILRAIKNLEDNPYKLSDADKIEYSELLLELGWEDNADNRKTVGYLLKDMGLIVKRTTKYRCLMLDDPINIKQLRKKYKRYHLGEQQEKLKV